MKEKIYIYMYKPRPPLKDQKRKNISGGTLYLLWRSKTSNGEQENLKKERNDQKE